MSELDTRALRALLEKATKGPWKWTPGYGQPQIEGDVEAPDMNPVLIAHGCGNEMATTAGVTGCMPEKLNDELRACPLHPSAPDRALIVALVNAAPALLSEVDGLRSIRDAQINVIETVRADRDRFMAERDALRDRVAELEAEVERVREALTPSGVTKAAYHGEFQIRTTMYDDANNEHVADTNVPWTTIKDIMKAISERAALAPRAEVKS